MSKPITPEMKSAMACAIANGVKLGILDASLDDIAMKAPPFVLPKNFENFDGTTSNSAPPIGLRYSNIAASIAEVTSSTASAAQIIDFGGKPGDEPDEALIIKTPIRPKALRKFLYPKGE